MLKKIQSAAQILLASVMVVPMLTGCATGQTGIANRYKRQQKDVPEYALVDTRFSSGDIQTDLLCNALQREVLYSLYKTGCEVNILLQDSQNLKITFKRPEASGKLTISTLPSSGMHLKRIQYNYRVNIVDYPATVEQDHHVNSIANEIATTLKKADIIQNAMANNH